MAVVWAVACLIFSAMNDLLFKFYARKPRPQGPFVSVVGISWLICCGLFFLRTPPANWQATLLWSVISGIFSVVGNLLMLDAMKSLDAGVCSTIYRLNLVPVTIGAALLLGENITLMQYIGIGCACCAVLAFLPKRSSNGKMAMAAFICMLIASLMRAGLGLSYRYGFMHGADENWVVAIDSFFWIIGGMVYMFCRERKMPLPADDRRKMWRYGLISGVLVTGITITMAQALLIGNASVVLPIAQMSFLLTGILGMILLKEKLTLMRAIALFFGVAAILLLTIKF